MSLEFKSEENFTINNVIMNPPYNKGMDIDFDFLAFDVASDNVVCIQPAKCFSAEATQKIQSNHSYGNFRDRIVPHISNICFYPDSLDVFGTYQADGIMYFKADKHNTFDKATVKNISNLQDNINSVTVRNMTNGQTIWNVGNEMIEYMGRYKRLNIDTNTKGRYCVNINNQLSIGGGGFAVKEQDIDGRWVTRSDIVGKGGMIFSPNTKDIPVIAKVIVVDTSKKESMEEISGTSSNVFFSNDINECESYKSYILSKVVRFFTLIGVNKLTVIDNNTLKFVPAPPFGVNGAYKFDHIYTDEGLYRMCGLDKSDAKTSNGVRYIDIIESIIRDKK
jgi:hypothetical protein